MSNGHYIFEGHDTVDLAQKYGTPLYVVSQDKIARSVNTIRAAFATHGITDYRINYAGKAFLNIAMCKIADKLDLDLDVVSGGELYTALAAGFDPKRITFHGSNKSWQEMKEALGAGVGTITIDSITEIDILNEAAKQLGIMQKVHLRLSPGVEASTHEYVQTGRVDSKFGIPISMSTRAARRVIDCSNLNLQGLHCHIGSQIYSPKPFEIAANAMIETVYNIKEMGVELSELNLGGGFGINYLQDEPGIDVDTTIGTMASVINDQVSQLGIKMPKIIVEPGRYIIGPAGITLYTVGIVKEIPFIRKYVSVDGGMTDNPRPALYGAVHNAALANKYDMEKNDLVTISGKCCETDTLIKDILLPAVELGDIVVVFNTGAYNYAMSSNYNRICRPSVVLLSGDKDELIVKRDTYEQIARNDVVASWL
ncbi:MAG: diaminopimelate decarboxylase [Eubacteriaceae bacterium]|nr:diaminopimelate decarboxylase [Eubacteriaceae bacterium]